jgi:hypothetical protein
VLLLLHVPPAVASVNVVEEPAHTVLLPDIVGGTAFTVTIAMLLQPVGNVYVIFAVPAVMPLTIPVADPTVAILVLPLVHVPPEILAVSVVVYPTQIFAVPEITGSGLTVTVFIE